MLGQVVDKLDSWLGRSFLLSCYAPCLVFAALNALVAGIESARVRSMLVAEHRSAGGGQAIDLSIALLTVAVVAFALSPGLRMATRLREGAGLPAFIAEPMLAHHSRKRDRLANRVKAVEARRANLPSTAALLDRTKEARSAGETLGAIRDDASIEPARALLDELRAHRSLNRPIEAGLLMSSVEAVSTALRSNCAEVQSLRPPVSATDLAAAQALDGFQIEMDDTLVPYAVDVSEQAEAREWESRSRSFAERELAPTRLGNEAAELRSYCRTRYGLEFDLFWPRLQLVIQQDDKLSAAIVRAKIQVDFSIVSLVLTVSSTLGWLAYFVLFGRNPVSLLVVVGVGPPMAQGWLGIVHASYADFSELVRSAVDVTRRQLPAASPCKRPTPCTASARHGIDSAVGSF